MAATLSTPVLMVLDALEGSTHESIADSALIAARAIEHEHAEVMGLILNRVSALILLPFFFFNFQVFRFPFSTSTLSTKSVGRITHTFSILVWVM